MLGALQRGEFCYVLTSRQMGKSSLMNHTAVALRSLGTAVAVLDLTAIGQNLSVEQWYDGLLSRLGRALDMEDEVEEYWQTHERQSPLQRWMGALQELVLPRCAHRLVIFIDEIDAVRSLPFSTDEFFAAIRECYNRRTEEPEFARLTFCLLGVATPSDLIQDTRTTPFNIGRRIELTDFTAAEASPLARGLGRDEAVGRGLLERVLYWTGGHPYLTQRLCQAMAADPEVSSAADADRHTQELFFSSRARERDDNLIFVRERLLNSEADRAAVLDLYRKVRGGKRVVDDEADPLVDFLRLSGIGRSVGGRLAVRNRIYERVFDPGWITQNMPDAELRRQWAAYRRGLLRAAAVSAVILAMMGGLVFAAINQARRADRATRREARQRALAVDRERAARHSLYASQLNLAQRLEEEGNTAGALELLEAWRPGPDQEDLRGFEWRYLWRLCKGAARLTLRAHVGGAYSVAFSPDGKRLVTGGEGFGLKLWDAATGRKIASLGVHKGEFIQATFSPDGRLIASASDADPVRLWDAATRRLIAILPGSAGLVGSLYEFPVGGLVFSPDGKILAAASRNHTARLWNVTTHRELGALRSPGAHVHSVAFSPDGRLLATGSTEGPILLWGVASQRRVGALHGHLEGVNCVAFSPDGKSLASGSGDNTVKLWDVAAQREVTTLRGHRLSVNSVAFSLDGRSLATGSYDNSIRLWDLATKQEVGRLNGHTAAIWSLALAPDGKTLASSSDDGTVKLWAMRGWGTEAEGGASAVTILMHQRTPISKMMALSGNGRLLAMASGDGTVALWLLPTRKKVAALVGHKARVTFLALSSDAKLLVSGRADRTMRVWDTPSRREVALLRGFADSPWNGALSPDGTRLAYRSEHALELWDARIRTRRKVASLAVPPGFYWGVQFSPDGRVLAAVSAPNTITLWDVATLRAIARLRAVQSAPLMFSPDGKTLAIGSDNTFGGMNILLWDLGSRRLIASLKGHTGGGRAMAFSPDGKTLAVSSAETISLWNLAIQQEVALLKGHTGDVMALSFTPDGSALVSAGADGTVRLWSAASFQETDPLQVVLKGAGDRSVTLVWRPVPSAPAYNVYRIEGTESRRNPSDTSGSSRALKLPVPGLRGHWEKLNSQPLVGNTFNDHDPALVNGRSYTFAVEPLFRGASGQTVGEAGSGDPLRPGRHGAAILEAIPAAPPLGFTGWSITEGTRCGSVSYKPGADVITLRGSGDGMWSKADECYFLSQPVEGDFQATVKALTLPTSTHPWARAGLMVRDSLEPDGREVSLLLTPAHGLNLQWRPARGEESGLLAGFPPVALRLPITLQLTRRGNEVAAACSRDGGKSFRSIGGPIPFAPPLDRELYVGLTITALDREQISEARFQDLKIEQR